MNITDDTLRRLEQVLSADFESAKQNLIFSTDNGYQVFDRYTILKKQNTVTVTEYAGNPAIFTSVRTALSWCIADKYNQIKLANEIKRLDEKRWRLRNDVSFSQKLTSIFKDPETRETALLKLETKQALLHNVETGLEKCANLAKYWQLRGFNNEIERTKRSAQNRDNRSSLRVLSR